MRTSYRADFVDRRRVRIFTRSPQTRDREFAEQVESEQTRYRMVVRRESRQFLLHMRFLLRVLRVGMDDYGLRDSGHHSQCGTALTHAEHYAAYLHIKFPKHPPVVAPSRLMQRSWLPRVLT